MSRSLTKTITALNDSEISVEVTSAPHEEVTVRVRDACGALDERRSFLPDQLEKAASWLHGTALNVLPESRYARQSAGDEDDWREPAPVEMERLRHGLTGLG